MSLHSKQNCLFDKLTLLCLNFIESCALYIELISLPAHTGAIIFTNKLGFKHANDSNMGFVLLQGLLQVVQVCQELKGVNLFGGQ